MNTRLKQFLAAENITQAQFADSINVVRASVSHVLSGRNNPSYEFIKSIMLVYPSLSMEWLMFGKGKMYKDPENGHTSSLPLLFPEADESIEPIELNIQEEPQEPVLDTQSISEIVSLDNAIQVPVKQRKVSKIIILFNDGTFQEM